MSEKPLSDNDIEAIAYDIAMPWTVLTKDRRKLANIIADTVKNQAKHQCKALQTQLDEANARLAMLSEKLAYYHQDAFHEHGDGFYENMAYNGFFEEVEEALNATKEHVEVWKGMVQLDPLLPDNDEAVKALITEYFGEKCDEFNAGCGKCQAWALYNYAPLALGLLVEGATETVTNERDALREAVELLSPHAEMAAQSRTPFVDMKANEGFIYAGLVRLNKALAKERGK